MGRKKVISTEELIRFADEYYTNNPTIELNPAALGKHIRTKDGMQNVQDTVIRRNIELREYLNSRNNFSKQEHHYTVASFHAMDIDKFLDKHTTRESIKKALIQRDSLYSSVAASAANIFDENKKLEAKCCKYKDENDNLKEALSKKEEKDFAKIAKEKNRLIKALYNIIETYVYPETANALLQRDGILKPVIEIIDADQVEKNLISANSSVSEVLKNDIVKGLMGNFDDKIKNTSN